MKKLIVEVGIKLNENLFFYDRILKENGLKNDYTVITHDIYYAKENLENLSEYEIKQKCIRLRNSYDRNGIRNDYYKIENNLTLDMDTEKVFFTDMANFEELLKEKCFGKVIDTIKIDHHYFKEGMNSKIQLQETEGLGLLLYYDNSNYYGYPLLEQRKMLIDELNSYGFNIGYDKEGIDKLRTLYHKKELYSLNQNTTYSWQ